MTDPLITEEAEAPAVDTATSAIPPDGTPADPLPEVPLPVEPDGLPEPIPDAAGLPDDVRDGTVADDGSSPNHLEGE